MLKLLYIEEFIHFRFFKSLLILLLFNLPCFDAFAQPGNDDCSNATFLCRGYVKMNEGNNSATSGSGDLLNCGDMNVTHSVWYYTQAYGNGNIDIQLSGVDSLNGLEVQIFQSAAENCNSLTPIICDVVNGPSGSLNISFTGTNGDYYYIMVDGNNGNQELFNIATTAMSNVVGEPSAVFSNIGGDPVRCLGDTFFIQNSTIINGGIASYEVNYQDGNGWQTFPGSQYDTIVYTDTGFYDIYYKVNHNYCNSDLDFISTTVQQLTVKMDTVEAYCPGFDIKILSKSKVSPASPSDNLIIDRYVWNIFNLQSGTPDTIIEINTGATVYDTILYEPKSDTIIIHLETYSNTCAPDTLIDTIALYTVQIDVGGDSLICYGDSLQLGVNFLNTGVLPYSYAWTPANSLSDSTLSMPVASPNDTTTYYLNVKDKHNCPAIDSVKILVNPILIVDAGVMDTMCFGDSVLLNSTIPIDSSGHGDISYNWSPSVDLRSNSTQSTQALPSISQFFTLIVSDSNLCTASDQVYINVSHLILDLGSDTSICLGDSVQLITDTSASISIWPLEYVWGPSISLNDTSVFDPYALPLDTTEYILNVTDSFGCSILDSIIINVNKYKINAGDDKLICYGDSVALDVDTLIEPGVSPLEFVWDKPAVLSDDSIAEPTAFPLITTSFKVTSTDSMGCLSEDGIVVNVNPFLDIQIGNDTLICFGDTLTLTADTTNGSGTSPLGFNWTPGDSVFDSILYQTQANPLDSTEFIIMVTDSNNCVVSDTIIVNVNPEFSISAVSSVSFVCFGDSVYLDVDTITDPGTAPYAYTWNPDSLLSQINIHNPIGIPSDTSLYTVSVTDANNCPSNLDSIIIFSNPQLTIDAGNDTLIYFGDTASLLAFVSDSGLAPYSYSWSPSDSLSADSIINPLAFPLDTTTYYITITDSANCQSFDSVIVNVNPPFNVSVSGDTFLCNGSSANLITTIVDGGTPGYTYSWTPNLFISDSAISNPVVIPNDTITYILTAMDANGAVSLDSIKIFVSPPLSLQISNDTLICFGDTINISANIIDSGFTPVTYSWHNSDSVFNPTALTTSVAPYDTSLFIFTLVDSLSCFVSDTVVVNVNPKLEIDIQPDTFICYGQNLVPIIDTSQCLGTPPFNYSWSPNLFISDSSDLFPKLSPLDTTLYTLYLEDASLCVAQDSFNVMVNPELDISLAADTLICYMDSLTLDAQLVASGSGVLTHLWSPSAPLDFDSLLQPIAFILDTQVFTLITTDSVGCSISDTIKVNINPKLRVTIRQDTSICYGDSISLTIDTTLYSGTPPHSYIWTPALSLSSASLAEPVASPTDTTAYYLALTDANACPAQDSVKISVTPMLDANLMNDSLICYGDSVILATNVSGQGIGAPIFLWSPASSLDDSSNLNPNAFPLDTTTYYLFMTDSIGMCSFYDSIIINVNPTLHISINNDTSLCYGDSLQLFVDTTSTIGTPPFTYLWSPSTYLSASNTDTPISTPLDSITYKLTLSDANSCSIQDSFEIDVSPELTLSLIQDTLICYGDSMIMPAIIVDSGTTNLGYSWLPATGLSDSSILNPLVNIIDSLTYTLVVTDQISLCSISDSTIINVNPEFNISIDQSNVFICYGDTADITTSIIAAGTSPYSLSWTPTDSISDSTLLNIQVYPLADVSYLLSVTDFSGCSTGDSVALKVNPQLSLSAGNDTLMCGYDSVLLNGLVSGGTAPYNVLWSPSDSLSSTSILNPLAYPQNTTKYYLHATDDSNCVIGPDSITLSVDPPINISMQIISPPINSSYGDGFCSWDSVAIEYSVSGGTAAYNLAWSPLSGLYNKLNSSPSSFIDTMYVKVVDDVVVTLTVTDDVTCQTTDFDSVNILRPSISTTTLCYIDNPLTSDFCIDSFETGTLFDWRLSSPLDSLIHGVYTTFDSIADSCVVAHFENVDSGDFQFSVEVNDTAKGCLDTLNFIFVKDSSVSVDLIAQDSFICYGEFETLSLIGDSLDLSYIWINNTTGDTLIEATRSIDVSPLITTEYKVVVTRHGCSFEDSLILNVNPELNISAGLDKDLCFGDSISLSPDSSLGGTAPLVFDWSPGLLTVDSNIFKAKVFPLDTTAFILLATDSNSCSSLDTMIVNVTKILVELGNDTIICVGDSFAFNIDTTTFSGSIPYIYSWSPNDSVNMSNIFDPYTTNMDSLQYRLMITDNKGCSGEDSVNINVIHFEIEAGTDTTICVGQSFTIETDTSLSVGISPIAYEWNTSLGLSDSTIYNPVFNGIDSLELIIKAHDNIGCVSSDTINVNVISLNLDIGNDTAICNGDSLEVNLDTTVLTGNSPYHFSWIPLVNVNNNLIHNPMAFGTDTFELKLRVTDSLGCIVHDTMNINLISLTIDAGSDTLICYGDSVMLQVDTSLIPGISPYSYNWSPTSLLSNGTIANPISSSLDTITYHVTVTDAISCFSSDSITVYVNPEFTTYAGNDTLICYSDSAYLSAEISLTAQGTSPYSYSWGVTGGGLANYISDSFIINPIVASTDTAVYTITITDNSGCIANDSITVNVNPKFIVYAGPDTLICYGDSIQLTIDTSAYPAISPYVYSWSPSVDVSDTSLSNPYVKPKANQLYSVLVTDASLCTASDNVTISVNPYIKANAGADLFVCYGDSIILNADTLSNIGSGNISISWSPSMDLSSDSILNPYASPLLTTDYIISIIDGNNCTSDDTMLLDVNPLLLADAGDDVFVCYGSTGQIISDTSGGYGSPPLSYSWSPAANLNNAAIYNPIADVIDTTSFTLVITDTRGCSSTDSMRVNVNPQFIIEAGSDTTICRGDTAVLLGDSGFLNGTPPLSFSWTPSASVFSFADLTPFASPLDTQLYYLTATDALLCIAEDSVIINVTNLNVELGPDLFICYDDSIQLSSNTSTHYGSYPYNYSWSPVANLNNGSIDNPLSKPLITTQYHLTVTDALGCIGADSMTLEVNPIITVDAGPSKDICLGDSIQIALDTTISPGTPPLSFLWSPAGSVSDAIVFDPYFSPSTTTTFTIDVTDSKGCSGTDQVEVRVSHLLVSAGLDGFICANDSFQLAVDTTIAPGTPPLTYQWSPSFSLNNNSIYNPIAFPSDTTTYILTVTDAVNCEYIDSVKIDVSHLSVELGADKFICYSDQIQLVADTLVSPGNPPYIYNWTPSVALSQTNVFNPIASPTDTQTYILKLTDQTACIVYDTINVLVNPQFSIDIIDSAFICYGDSVQVVVDTTVMPTYYPYTYSWSGSDSISDNTAHNPFIYPLDTTIYSVIVSDANNCTASDSIKINVNPRLSIALTGDTNFLCYGDTVDLMATLIDSGTLGTPVQHVYQWYPTDSISDTTMLTPWANPTSSVKYNIRVTDGKLCTDESSLYVRVNPPLTVDAGQPDTVCAWEAIQLNAIVVDSGTLGIPAPHGFLWNPSLGLSNITAQNPIANIDTTTMFFIELIDSNYCIALDSVEIKVSPPIIVDIGEDTMICHKDYIQFNANISSGIPPYNLSWQPSNMLSDPTVVDPVSLPLDTTIYILTVQDSNECIAADTMTVFVNPAFEIEITADTSFLCYGDTAHLVADTLSGLGGTSPFNILWTPADSLSATDVSSITANPTDSTIYYVSFTDSSGCYEWDSIHFGVNPRLEVVLTADTSFICYGDSLDLNVQMVGAGTPGVPTSHLYIWNPVDSISDTTILSPFANPTQSTDYTMTIIDGNLCSFTDSITIIVNPELSVDAGSDITICNGQNQVLNAQVTAPGTPGTPAAHSYLWSNAQYLNNASVSNPNSTPDTTTIFSVTITDSKLCTATDSMKLFVHELIASAGSDDTICKGDMISLTANANGVVYWYDNGFNGQFLPNPNEVNVTYVPHPDSTGLQLLSIVATDTLGLCNFIMDTLELQLDPKPRGSALILSDSICRMDTILIGGTLTDASSIIWTDNNQGGQFIHSNNVINNKYVPEPSHLGQICLSMISYGSSFCSPDTADICFDILESPRVELDASYRFCQKDSIALNPQFFGAINPIWTDSNMLGSFIGNMAAPLYANSDTSDIFYVYVHTESDTFCNNGFDSALVIIDSLPDVYLEQLNEALCYTDTVLLEASGAEYYLWSSDDPIYSDSLPDTSSQVTTHFTGTTNYTVVGVDSNGCQTTVNYQVETKENVKPDIQADYDLVQCYPLDVSFDINTSLPSGVSITDVSWSFGDGNGSTDLNPVHLYERNLDSTYPAKYQVVMDIEYSNSCINSDTIFVDVCENFVLPNVFTPNGDGQNDIFRIPGYYKSGGPCHFVVHDRWGKTVYESLEYANDWDGIGIGGKVVEQGLYYYTLSCADSKAWTGWVRLIK